MNFLKNIISKLVSFFRSGKAEAAFNQAVALVPKAVPIVQAIAAMAPNKTLQEVCSAFAKYGVPFAVEYDEMPPETRGYLLLHLATQLLEKEAPGIATNILNTAVQLAVTAVKAG